MAHGGASQQCALGIKHYSCQLAAFPYSTCYNEIPVSLGSVTITDVVVAAFALTNALTALVSLYKWVRRHDKDEQAALRQNYGSVGTAAFFVLTALACAVGTSNNARLPSLTHHIDSRHLLV